MHLFASVVGIVLLHSTLANPFPQYSGAPLSVNTYGMGTDTESNSRPQSVLPITLDTGDFDDANLDPLLLAKGSGYRCAEGLGFACCDTTTYDPYYLNGEVITALQIYHCGKDQSNCPFHLADVRSCCRELGGNHPKPTYTDNFDRHRLACAKAE